MDDLPHADIRATSTPIHRWHRQQLKVLPPPRPHLRPTALAAPHRSLLLRTHPPPQHSLFLVFPLRLISTNTLLPSHLPRLPAPYPGPFAHKARVLRRSAMLAQTAEVS
ncbi:hypothetical protein K432DRAFT_387691 [Lepidopterella palustris CBS 459.81]|uniref:Uncharacterized protein n=1 Tax=Lepidopterella palustris CBS 459.81 TaxID=1314670 RepID=A0A8E2DWF7_9PEZI|nr:hypothetical protein K432DRAFT_387691 [Lepidopterella palustris CBS 459.81]